jgi:hypothetical protein
MSWVEIVVAAVLAAFALGLLFALAVCRAASVADELDERMMRELRRRDRGMR